MTTAIVWLRRDLRVHDHPGLVRAAAEHERVVAAWVFDPALLGGRFASGARTQFVLESLHDVDAGIRQRGGRLAIRYGRPADQLVRLAVETGAQRVLWASDVSPYARRRDREVSAALSAAGVEPAPQPGLFVTDVGAPRTGAGRPFTVFSPFWRHWQRAPRRPVLPAPERLESPAGLEPGEIPTLAQLGMRQELSEPGRGGEARARAAMDAWLRHGLQDYDEARHRLAGGSSGLSPYLRHGNLSARELEARVAELDGRGPAAYRRQLCWRDFYAHVLLAHPDNARQPLQERYRALAFDDRPDLLEAWRAGRTGYPLVDAGMRQLARTGWMHNRARLVVASFLTRDLHLDWRAGEAHFMRLLLCGCVAQNNGNWQWVASVGVDPQPHYRRLYNPALHQARYDPQGEYVRRWVPELARVPLERLAEPWRMSEAEQEAAGCVIGRDYPAPIVDHAVERRRALERYAAVSEARGGAAPEGD